MASRKRPVIDRQAAWAGQRGAAVRFHRRAALALLGSGAIIAALWPSAARSGPREDFFKGIELDRPTMVRSALAAGVDPNAADVQGRAGLLLAMRDGCFEAAEVLLGAAGLDIDRASPQGETALMLAALRGHLAWMERLVARGAAVQRSGWSPLHYAASGPEPKAVQWLLERGALVDARSPNGSTPLMMAAGYGAIDGVDLLLARGADAAVRNQAGAAAADFARRAGRDELARRIERAVR
jgi:ankyrin repeat protein